MGAEWLVFGALAAADELGNRMRASSFKRAYEKRQAVAKVMQCSPEFKSELWNTVSDPSKYGEVWDRIELFKRDNPQLCQSKNWEFVGKRRLPLISSKPKTAEAITNFKETTVRLLCRTYGKITPEHANELSLIDSYRITWLAFGDSDEIKPVWRWSDRSDFISTRQSCQEDTGTIKEKLRQEIKEARGEQHDAIVYMSALEFDPNIDPAVDYVTEMVLCIAVKSYPWPGDAPAGVFPIVTAEEYEQYIADGGEDNAFVRRSIADREERERSVKRESRMNYLPEDRQFTKTLVDFMWAYKIANLSDDVVPSELSSIWDSFKRYCMETFFDGSVLGILYLFVMIISILWVISEIF